MTGTDKDHASQKIAVALQYQAGKDAVPRLTAKGRGDVAARIVEVAEAAGVHVEHNEPLAQSLSLLELESRSRRNFTGLIRGDRLHIKKSRANVEIALVVRVIQLEAERSHLPGLINKGKSPAKPLLKARILLKADQDSTPRAYQLMASNACLPFSTLSGAKPLSCAWRLTKGCVVARLQTAPAG